jgi:hypothetical protein
MVGQIKRDGIGYPTEIDMVAIIGMSFHQMEKITITFIQVAM